MYTELTKRSELEPFGRRPLVCDWSAIGVVARRKQHIAHCAVVTVPTSAPRRQSHARPPPVFVEGVGRLLENRVIELTPIQTGKVTEINNNGLFFIIN